MKVKWISLLLLNIILSGCSNSGDSGKDVTERPSGDISGTAFDGLIQNGDITVSTLGGEVVGSGATDDKGIYSIGLTAVASQPLVLEISSGSYTEEFSGQTIVLRDGKRMTALINYVQGSEIHSSITFYTTIAAGLAVNPPVLVPQHFGLVRG